MRVPFSNSLKSTFSVFDIEVLLSQHSRSSVKQYHVDLRLYFRNWWKFSKILLELFRHFNVTLYITKQFTASYFVPTVSLLSVDVCKEMIPSNVL